MNGFNTFILLLINAGLIIALVYAGDRIITAERERDRARRDKREMMKMVDDLRAKVNHLEAF